jgi:hypothetical protein
MDDLRGAVFKILADLQTKAEHGLLGNCADIEEYRYLAGRRHAIMEIRSAVSDAWLKHAEGE